MLFDAHIHFSYGPCDSPREFLRKTALAHVSGGHIFSVQPAPTRSNPANVDYRWEARLDAILAFTSETPGFLPYFYLDPTEPDAVRQVERAAELGIRGFKIICTSFYPQDTLRACEAIAATGRPVMFHSGILGGGRDEISGRFNRPVEFECLFAVRGLRFSLAHLGWPWVDEYLGMVAKASFTRDPEFGNEMYFDLTPGTPGIYREEALRKLYLTGYHVKSYTLWGTDLTANDYEGKIALFWEQHDQAIMNRIITDHELARLPFQNAAPDLADIFDLAARRNAAAFDRA